MGAGPERLLSAGLTDELRADGHSVQVEELGPESDAPPAEIRTAFELNRVLAQRVGEAVAAGALPVILAGNCNTAVGTIAGLSGARPGVLWFDSHGDFNTPETTTGGFLDGMALAIVTGRCWSRLAATVPGFRPVPEHNVVLLGARDLDPLEQELLADSELRLLPPDRVRAELDDALTELQTRVREVYVHLDLDVLDPEEARANALAAPGGLSLAEMRSVLTRIRERFRVRAIALTAYDPAHDAAGRVPRVAGVVLRTLLQRASDG